MTYFEQEQLKKQEEIRNMRKHNLIDNLGSLGLSDKKEKEFIKYYYLHLDDMNLMEALDEFKQIK